jgi:hypothetical protein
MRLAEWQRRKRADLAWFLSGIVLTQVALAIGVECFWPAVRDPEYDEIKRIVRARGAAAPGRPLVIALGSSRTQMALAAERLNRPGDAAAPVVINAAISGGGPMMSQIVLRRLLRAGLRPDLVFVEIMPLALSAREGAPVEERQRGLGRFTLREAVRLSRYYAERYRLCYPWLVARAAPSHRYHAELRGAVGIGTAWPKLRDDFGWMPYTKRYARDEIARRTQVNLDWYASALIQPAVAPGALRALGDLVQLCHDRHIAVVLLVPAEGSAFRGYAPHVEEAHVDAIRQLAYAMAVPCIDSRTWVDDDGFWDGHHATENGARQYTERFAREALEPHVRRLRSSRE